MAEEMETELVYQADHPVTRYEMASRHAYERELAEQRMKISELTSEKISDKKDIEVYKQVRADIKDAVEPLQVEIKELQEKAAAQLAWNAAAKGAMAAMRKDIEDLEALTVRKIPNASVTPGWDIP